MTCARSSKRTREGRHQAQTVWQQPAWKPVLTSCPPSSQRSLTYHWNCAKSLWPLTPSTLSLWTVTAWSTLQSSEHQNDQTQEQFLPSGNPSHEHLTLNTIIHYLFITHSYFSFQICTCQTSHIIVCIIYCVIILYIFCTLPICIFVYYSLVSVSCPVSVILLHCGASVRITNSSCVNIPGQ